MQRQSRSPASALFVFFGILLAATALPAPLQPVSPGIPTIFPVPAIIRSNHFVTIDGQPADVAHAASSYLSLSEIRFVGA